MRARFKKKRQDRAYTEWDRGLPMTFKPNGNQWIFIFVFFFRLFESQTFSRLCALSHSMCCLIKYSPLFLCWLCCLRPDKSVRIFAGATAEKVTNFHFDRLFGSCLTCSTQHHSKPLKTIRWETSTTNNRPILESIEWKLPGLKWSEIIGKKYLFIYFFTYLGENCVVLCVRSKSL